MNTRGANNDVNKLRQIGMSGEVCLVAKFLMKIRSKKGIEISVERMASCVFPM